MDKISMDVDGRETYPSWEKCGEQDEGKHNWVSWGVQFGA